MVFNGYLHIKFFPAVTVDLRTTAADALHLSHQAFTSERAPRGATPEHQHLENLHKSSPFSTATNRHPPATHIDLDTKLLDGSIIQKRTNKTAPDTHTASSAPQIQEDGLKQYYPGIRYTQLGFSRNHRCPNHCVHQKCAYQHQTHWPPSDIEQ